MFIFIQIGNYYYREGRGMKRFYQNEDISELMTSFEFEGEQDFFEELVASFPLAFRHILNDVHKKSLKNKSVSLPNNKGVLKFSKKQGKIKVRLEESKKKEFKKTFSEVMDRLIKEVQREKKQTLTKKREKSLVQKGLNKQILNKVYNFLQDEED
jgi:hypothetical protein